MNIQSPFKKQTDFVDSAKHALNIRLYDGKNTFDFTGGEEGALCTYHSIRDLAEIIANLYGDVKVDHAFKIFLDELTTEIFTTELQAAIELEIGFKNSPSYPKQADPYHHSDFL